MLGADAGIAGCEDAVDVEGYELADGRRVGTADPRQHGDGVVVGDHDLYESVVAVVFGSYDRAGSPCWCARGRVVERYLVWADHDAGFAVGSRRVWNDGH